MMAMEFLVRGARQYREPGVYMAFEETAEDLTKNFASLHYDLQNLAAKKLIALDHVHVERTEIEETGEYDLEGLFIRLQEAIDSIGAKRVVLDTIEVLFSGLANAMIVRSEIRRLFRWLKDKGVTAIITGERGEEGGLTRHGLEEYVADCVISLDNRVVEQTSTRRLRLIKYRGSAHGTNEYPFLIDEQGVSVLPITSVTLSYGVSAQRVPTGIGRLDAMLGGEGYYRGSSILVSGTAGTGKSSMAGIFAEAACRRGEKCLYFAFEEANNQIVRNLRSISVNLGPWLKKGLLQIHAARPTFYGLEMHLATVHKLIDEFKPQAVVVDPITNLAIIGSQPEVRSMLTRLIDYLKMKKITALFTNLSTSGTDLEHTEAAISSLMDTWLLLRDVELGGERNRVLYVLKSRGMAHSNQVREFLITNKGIKLQDVYLGPEGVLTGSSRTAQEAREKSTKLAIAQEIERKQREVLRKQQIMEAQMVALRSQFESEKEELDKIIGQEQARKSKLLEDREQMARMRKAG
jgi:circadian clock protein KaiC